MPAASPPTKISRPGAVAAAEFFPFATIALLLACAAATLAFDASGGSELFVCFPREPFQVYGAPAILSLFTHEGFPHLVTNGLFLAYSGYALEKRFGAERLLALFLLCGLGGIGGQAYVTATGTIGASGAVCGLIVVMLATREGGRGDGALAAAVAVWLCLDFLGVHDQKLGNAGLIGHGAHLGGAAAGLLLSFLPGLLEPAEASARPRRTA